LSNSMVSSLIVFFRSTLVSKRDWSYFASTVSGPFFKYANQ